MTAPDIAARYAEAKTCECGALIEDIDIEGFFFWAHVKRTRFEFDHAAVPALPKGDWVSDLLARPSVAGGAA